ncbi:MAG: hypothetical protein ACKVS9_01395 [Phycisphaerae bacterium]
MAIEFHCNHCGKQVRAPDEAGGKHGKCPSCHQSVYIPLPDAELEPLALTPLDDSFEREKARLMKETREMEARVLRDRDAQPERGPARGATGGSGTSGGAGASARPFIPQMSFAEMNDLVTQYAAAMMEGKLAEADALAVDIRKHPKIADEVIQRISSDEIPPPRLAKIPKPLMAGFFRQLREQK